MEIVAGNLELSFRKHEITGAKKKEYAKPGEEHEQGFIVGHLGKPELSYIVFNIPFKGNLSLREKLEHIIKTDKTVQNARIKIILHEWNENHTDLGFKAVIAPKGTDFSTLKV